MMPCNMFAFTVLDDSSSSAVVLRIASVDFSNCSIGLSVRLDSVPSLPSRTSASITPSLWICFLHDFGMRWLSRSRPCCDLPAACLPPLFAGWQSRPATEPLVPESAPPCSVSVRLLPDLHEVRLHISTTVLEARTPPVRLFWSVCSHLWKLIGCRPRSPPRLLKSSPSSLATVCSQTRIVTRHAGLDLTCVTGLTAARYLHCGLFTG